MLSLHEIHAIADRCPYDFTSMQLVADGDGFLGIGADLSPETLLHAYRCGVFPWFNSDDPICWWSPDPRCVITPQEFRPSKSLSRTAKKSPWILTTNYAFDAVIDACSQPRSYGSDTWIHDEIKTAYHQLHQLGVAASIEIWEGQPLKSDLIGGLYGVNIGGIFCGESMFHRRSDASKLAFWGLMLLAWRCDILLVDCQLQNSHLSSLGATPMTRKDFMNELNQLIYHTCDNLAHSHIQMNCSNLLDFSP